MTILEKMKQLLGSDADKEYVESAEESTVVEKEDSNESNSEIEKEKETTSEQKETKSEDVKDAVVEEEVVPVAMFGDGWFDQNSGLINLDLITNEEAKAAISILKDAIENERNTRKINDAINVELDNYALNVSKETLYKVLDTSGVKIDENGAVTGVKEALENLKSKEASFFLDKEKLNNPLNEGFNPVEKSNNDNVNSFSDAFRLMEEIN